MTVNAYIDRVSAAERGALPDDLNQFRDFLTPDLMRRCQPEGWYLTDAGGSGVWLYDERRVCKRKEGLNALRNP